MLPGGPGEGAVTVAFVPKIQRVCLKYDRCLTGWLNVMDVPIRDAAPAIRSTDSGSDGSEPYHRLSDLRHNRNTGIPLSTNAIPMADSRGLLTNVLITIRSAASTNAIGSAG